jgi:hypothetical protein
MRRAGLLVILLAWRCATLAESAGGDSNLPSSGAGPFRKLASGEVDGVAPNLLDDEAANYREPSALALSDSVALYVVMANAQATDVIARTRATDDRTFFGATADFGHKPQQVLASDQTWEGPNLAHPSALKVGTGIWLYYASNGSIGLAQSSDGLTFTKVGAPVLVADALGPIASASVAQLPGGSFDMMFAQGSSIYEATSADGLAWQRVDADPSTPAMDPVLAPAPSNTYVAPGALPPFDTLSVADPCFSPRMTAANRLQARLLYTGYAQAEGGVQSAIGFAARYGDSGPLVRAAGAVYSVALHESSPALFPTAGMSFLYVEQDAPTSEGPYRVIAGGISPPTLTLPPPSAYPPSP